MIRSDRKDQAAGGSTRTFRVSLVTLHAGLCAAVCTVALLAGCASPWANDSADLSEQDSTTALGIKAALIDEPGLAGAAIDVTMVEGRARLTGFVETDRQLRLAARIAEDYDGVSGVVNEIVVK